MDPIILIQIPCLSMFALAIILMGVWRYNDAKKKPEREKAKLDAKRQEVARMQAMLWKSEEEIERRRKEKPEKRKEYPNEPEGNPYENWYRDANEIL